jgi:hypothetical protein
MFRPESLEERVSPESSDLGRVGLSSEARGQARPLAYETDARG